MNLPDCMYDYRYERESRAVYEYCEKCHYPIYQGDEFKYINKEFYHIDCWNNLESKGE